MKKLVVALLAAAIALPTFAMAQEQKTDETAKTAKKKKGGKKKTEKKKAEEPKAQ